MASNYRGFSDRLKGLSSGKEEEEKRVSSSSSNPQQKQSGQYKSFSERVGSTEGNTNTVSSAISRAVGTGKMTPFEAAATILQYGNYAKMKEESEKTEPTYRNLDESLDLGSATPLSRLSRPLYADTAELPDWAKEKTGQTETPQVETPVVSSDVSFVEKASASKARKAEIQKLNREINGETFERDLISVPLGAVIGDEKKKKAYISAKEKTIAQKKARYEKLLEEESNTNIYEGLETEPDFAELSKPTKDMSLSTYKDKADFLYGFINGKEGFSDFKNMHGWDDEFAEGTYKFMLPNEKHKFNYLYNKYGGEYAVEYADSLIDELNRRRGMDRAYTTDTFGEKIGLAADQTVQGWGTSAKQIWENVAGSGDAVPLAPSQYAYQKVRSEEENWLTGAAMDLTSAGVDMLPMIAVSYATAGLGNAVGFGTKAATTAGKLAASTTMLGNVYGRSYNQKLREGYSKDQANTYALIIGGLEGGLSYALSGVSSLGGGGWKVLSKAGSKVIGKPAAAIAKLTGVDKAVSRLATSKVGQVFGKAASSTAGRFIGKSIVSGNKEGIEEGLQEILEPIVSSMVFNEKYKGADIGDVAYAYLLGAVLGGGFEATNSYRQARVESVSTKSGKAIIDNAMKRKAEELGISVEELDAATKQEVEESIVRSVIEEGLASDEGSAPYQVAKELQTKLDNGQKISAFELGNLYATEVQDVRAKITEEMEKADAEQAPITKDFGTYGKSAFRDLRNQFPNVSVEELADSFNTAYQVGREGTEMNKVEFVNQAQVDAYNAGRLDATVAELPAEKGYATVYGKESGFIDTNPNDGIDKALKDNLNTLGKALGVKIMMVDTLKGKNGKGANAEYSNGIVRIARDSDKPFIVAAKHEITHHLEKAAPKQYKSFANHALEIVSARDGVVASHIIEGYLKQGYSESEAYHEVAADFTEYILTDESALTEFVEESAKSEEKRSIVQAFFDAIHDFVAKIKKAFGGNIEQTNDATVRAFGATVEQLEKAERLWKDALKAAKEYAESHPDGFNANDNNTSFKFKGINKYGIEVYETSEDILALPWKQRKKLFLEKMTNEYKGRTAKFVKGNQVYYARFEEEDVRKNIYGDDQSDVNGRDAKVNTGADGNIFELVENATYDRGSGEKQGKTGKAHVEVTDWDYYVKTVQIDGRVFDLLANVRRKPDGEFVYSIGLTENKTKKAAPPRILLETEGLKNGAQATFNGRVPQKDGNVKSQYSLKNSKGNPLTQAQAEYFKDSVVRDKDGNLLVVYHGTNGEKFTVFDRKKSSHSNLYGRGFYFTDSESHAKQYGGAEEFYLNITNPVSTTEKTITERGMRRFLEAVAGNEEDFSFENYGYEASVDSVLSSVYSGKSDFAMLYDVSQTAIGDMVAAVELFNDVNGTFYDGLILDTEIVAFYPEQIKSVENEAPTNDPDVRFSMKSAREDGNTLIALHNLWANKLQGAIDLGGFPMPSIAVVKDNQGFDKFGDISVLFRKDTISPTDRRNKIYGGDAWTPTAPRTGIKVSESVTERIYRTVRDLLDGTDIMSEYRLMLDQDNVEDALQRNGGNFRDAFERNESLKIAFLKHKGIPFNLVMREKQYSNVVDNHVLRKIDRALGGKSADLANASTEEVMKAEPLVRKLVNDFYEAKGVGRIYTDKFYFSEMESLLRVAGRYAKEGQKKIIDSIETRKRLENKFTKKLTAEYGAWLDELSKGIVEKRGIRNDKDIFTPSGSRRSFEQLYMDYTLENIVKAMKSQSEKGGGVFGSGNMFGASTKEYGSIADVKKDSSRLVTEDEETHKARKAELDERLDDIVRDLGARWDTGRDAIVEALVRGKTVRGIMRELGWYKQHMNWNVTEENAQAILDLAKDISEMPTEYFEAKPQRAVRFDEVAAVILPKKTDATIKAQLEEMGVKVLTYDPKKEGDRLKKLNSVKGVRFSQKGDNVLAEVNKLRQVNAALKEQFKRTKFAKVDKKSLDSFTKKLLKDYSSEADINETRDALDDLYTYMANGEGKNQPVWEEVWERAQKVAESVLEGAVVVDDSLYQEYKDLRDTIRKTGITIDPMYDKSLPGYESINEFRKRNFGRIKIVKNGVSVDSFYQELADMYPQFFDADAHMTEPDQLLNIAEVLDNLRPIEFNPNTRDMRESINWLADDIIERFYELPQATPTFADRQHQKLVRKMIESGHKREEAVAKERSKREEAVAKVKEHYKAKEARTKERRSASTYKEKIKKHVSTISKMLIKGNDKSHVPEVMRSVVGEFLSVLDLTTPRQLEMTKDRLNELRNLYTKIAEGKTEIDVEVDPDFFAYVDTVLNGLKHGGDAVSISDLNVDELESLYRVVLAVERSIYMHNRIMTEGKNAEISELASRVMAELKTDKAFVDKANRIARFAADTLNMDMLNPQDFFIQLGGTMNGLFQSIRDGFDKKIRHLAEAKEYMNRLTKGVDVKELSGKNAVAKEFELQGGKKIKLTPAQVMSLYLLQKQPDATRHIYEGGIKAAPVVAREGKSKRARIVQDYEVVRVTPEDVSTIIGSMSAEQKKIADGIGKFFTDFTAKWGNEVSLALYGYKKFTVENYFPIVSDKNYLNDVFGETTDATLKNMGSTKARIEGANNPIVIEDAFDVFSRQADTMSSYNAFVIPLSDIQRVYNAKSLNGSVKQSIEKRYGARATNYFKKLMVDINGGARWNGGSQLMNTLISKYKQSKMGLNLRVILQQPSAFFRAQAVIDAKYLAEAMTHKSSADVKTIYKYAPIAQWKDWGYFSMDTGKQMKEVLLGQKDLSDVTMWAAGKMDELTWKRLWTATEMEIQDKRKDLKVGSEEYYTEVGKRFSEIVDRTQVVDSVLHRSQLMRNPDTLVRMSASFMNEPFKSYNMVRTAVTEFRRNPSEATKNALVGAAVGYLSSIVINHIITAFVDTLRGDDEDEEWLEKMYNKVTGKEGGEPKTWQEQYVWHFFANIVDEPMTMFPYLKDVVSMLQGFDVKRMDMQGIGDFINAAKRATSDKFTPMQKVLDVGSKFADLFGVPVSNVKREVETLTKLVLDIADSPMMEYQVSKALYTVSANKAKYVDILYNAYKTDDMDVYNELARELVDNGVSPSYIESGIKKRAVKDGASASDVSKKTFDAGIKLKYEVEGESEDGFSADDLTGSQYTRYNSDRGQMLDSIVSDFQSRGYDYLDEEATNNLIDAAYKFANATALESASNGEYESETKWINDAQEDAENGMSYADAVLANKFNYTSDVVDLPTFMEFKERVGDLESGVDYEKGASGARKRAIIALLESMNLTQKEFNYLLGTEYKNTSKSGGFGSR